MTLAAALDGVEAALAVLGGVALGEEPEACLAEAAARVQVLADRLVARQVGLVGAVERRGVHHADGAASVTGWLAGRWRVDHWEAAAKVEAARRLRGLPALQVAFDEGAVTWAHVAAVTRAAVPGRLAAVQTVEEELVELARRVPPRQLRTALRLVRDAVDPDGSDAEPLPETPGPDPRRHLDVSGTLEGLCNVQGLLDPVTGELLRTLLDAYTRPDPPDLPVAERRSAAQRRHDALHEALTALADRGVAPTRHGAVPHVLLMVDVLSLLGLVEQATRPDPTLRFSGATTIAVARRLLAQAVKATVVATAGPWRVVGVGATSRVLPVWLRPLLQMLHQRCRGPDCDRPPTWADVHHVEDWDTHHDTDLNRSIPLCRAHHTMVSSGEWTVAYDTDTGICTWTGPDGRIRTTTPPPP